jgi:LmbE family N-acetylglucosaminyl deacetylase
LVTTSESSVTSSASSIVFLHAHPDDESIFTGGTIAKLTAAGVSVTLVVATDDDTGPTRRLEVEEAASILKIDRVDFLGYPDSGLGPRPAPGGFATVSESEAAARVATIAGEVGAGAIVYYDPGGIYGHPDHLAVNRVGRRAARMSGLVTTYESTVDREHLHFVATHLVGEAVEALMHASAADRPEGLHADMMAQPAGDGSPSLPPYRRPGADVDGRLGGGMPTVLINTVIDVVDVLDRKRSAMAAHRSQIPSDSDVLQLAPATFEAVYGLEWYRRSGPETALDRLR